MVTIFNVKECDPAEQAEHATNSFQDNSQEPGWWNGNTPSLGQQMMNNGLARNAKTPTTQWVYQRVSQQTVENQQIWLRKRAGTAWNVKIWCVTMTNKVRGNAFQMEQWFERSTIFNNSYMSDINNYHTIHIIHKGQQGGQQMNTNNVDTNNVYYRRVDKAQYFSWGIITDG